MTNHKKDMKDHVALAARKAERDYKYKNPDADGLKLKAGLIVFKPRQKAVRDVPIKAVGLFLRDRTSLKRSNAEIAAELGKDIGAKVPLNILTETLDAKHLKKVKELLDFRKIDLDLSVYNTPSKIKKALRAGVKSEAATVRFLGEITFSNDAVIVGAKPYPIQTGGGVSRIHVGKRKLNVETLKLLLCGPV